MGVGPLEETQDYGEDDWGELVELVGQEKEEKVIHEFGEPNWEEMEVTGEIEELADWIGLDLGRLRGAVGLVLNYWLGPEN